ncbi:MAG: RagB/SusD family nutrient uptake outer membrane protein [Bacteroidales bacterium]|nr:RagB/SusD family nutrient uptake outer membrane protein [Bacteroidales bacterium]
MRTKILFISIVAATLFLTTCKDFLEIEPLDRVSPEQVFSDISGIKTVLATVYNKMPMEDFNYEPNYSLNFHGKSGSNNSDGGWALASHTDEAVIQSNAGGSIGSVSDGYWDYNGIRQVNQFFATIQSLDLDDALFKRLSAEGHFVRAYQYFGLAKRYGGVPIITEVQQVPSDPTDSSLYVARATEKATWDFVLSECDLAIADLPETVDPKEGSFRASKWAAYALKSRAALFAASVAKHWNKAALIGDAVNLKLVGGMTSTDANNYYLQCINASKAIIDNSGKQLYKPNPANAAEAAKNFQTMFEDPPSANIEVIFKKAYIDGSTTSQQGHCTDLYFQPTQTKLGSPYMFARYGVALDQVDAFEDYTDDGNGVSIPVKTRTDGVEDQYLTDPKTFDISAPYISYDNQYDIFTGKDARLMGSVILPGSMWKGVLINCQGGLIKTDGSKLVFTDGSAVGLDGNTYYCFGSNNIYGYSSFAKLGGSWDANYSSTGFIIKKFLQEAKTVNSAAWSSKVDWIDFRLAEIYLNYAEAAIESGQGDAALAKTYLNALRKRAAHTDEIPATVENIIKERRVELAFEGHRYWDLVRRRDMHTLYTLGTRKVLIPILDLRQNPPKYMFLRATNYYDQQAGGRTFTERSYYLAIPGTATNQLVQNPQY